MTKYFKAEYQGRVYTRTSLNKTYTHCILPVQSWASSRTLAEKAARAGEVIVEAQEIDGAIYRAIMKAKKEQRGAK